MTVLCYHPDSEKLKILSFCIESELGHQVKPATSIEQCLGFLFADKVIDLLIITESEKCMMIFEYLTSAGAKIPAIFLHKSMSQIPFPDLPIIAQIAESEAADKITSAIKANFAAMEQARNTIDADYCRIGIELLLKTVPLQGEVFVRLSNIKFVKLFNSGAQFTKVDLDRICGAKKIEYLYVLKKDAPQFVTQLKGELEKIAKSSTTNDPDGYEMAQNVQETIHNLAQKIGFTPEVVGLAKAQVTLALKLIGTSPRLSNLVYNSVLKNKNYLSSHSVILAHIACCIASQMDWPSESTFHKLTLAAFLHDIILSNPEHAKIRNRADLTRARESLTESEYTMIKNHPFEAGEMVNKLTEVPSDVCTIVQQHHEQSDGTGFPRGLHATSIAPLAALFIVAHDVVDRFIAEGDKFDMQAYWTEKLPQYTSGTFKKISRAIKISSFTEEAA